MTAWGKIIMAAVAKQHTQAMVVILGAVPNGNGQQICNPASGLAFCSIDPVQVRFSSLDQDTLLVALCADPTLSQCPSLPARPEKLIHM